ncbi:Phage-related minor tail protein [Clostridioides difficile]|uniref:phage tail tape measure protein n=1 Tax=Clostridioides difficile TaxID=1496 RepID=UPI00097FE73D|nr:phage tail tape measure protein [Clostridioides difficile]SJQ60806.1 Phage-related minor tail protein [Clostridioides difficile]HBH3496238.1 phage tail tape measure protein [Clostridioides difficile]
MADGSIIIDTLLNTEDAEKQLNNLADTMKKKAKNALAIAGIGASLGAIGKQAIDFGDEYQKAMNSFESATGNAEAKAKGFGEALQQVYANNFGEDMGDISEVMSLISQKLDGIDASNIQEVTESAIMMRDTFDMDIGESLNGVNSMMRQFGVSAKESYNLIAQGVQQGLNQNDDLGDQLAEYSTYYAQMGFSAEEMFNMMKNGAESGVYQIDYLNDALKEFNIRAKDGSNGTKEAFEALGFNADELTKKFASGGSSAKEAFIQVTTALNNLDDNVLKNQIGVQLFGTKFEDLEADAVTALTNIEGSISSSKDKLEEINKIKYNSFGEAVTGIGRQMQVNLLLPISEGLLPVLNDLANRFAQAFQNENTKNAIRSTAESIGSLIGTVVKLISLALTPLINVITFLVQHGSLVAPLITGIGVAFAGLKIAGIVRGIQKSFTDAQLAVRLFVTGMAESGTTLTLYETVVGLVTKKISLAQVATNLWKGALTALGGPIGLTIVAVGALIAVFVSLWKNNEGFRDAVISIWNNIKEAGAKIFSQIAKFFTETIPQAMSKFIGFVKNNWQGLLLFLVNPFAGAFKLIYDNCEGFRNTVNSIFNKIIGIFKNVLNFIKNNWKNIGSMLLSPFVNAFKAIYNSCVNFKNKVFSFFSNVVKGFVTFGKNIITGIVNGLLSGIGLVIDTVKNIGSLVVNTFKKVLKIHSPSKVTTELGEFAGVGFANGIKNTSKDVVEATKELISAMEKNLETNKSKFEKICEAITTALKNQYESQKDIQIKALDERLKVEEKASNDRLKVYEKEYNEKLKYLDTETNEKTNAIQEQIDAIDKQIEEEQKAEEEKAYNEKISDLDRKLATAKNQKEREKIQKEISEAQADRQKKLLDEQRQQEKNRLKEQIENIKTEASNKKEQYKEEYDNQKEAESKKLELIKESNASQKEEIEKYFSELLEETNIQNEARRLLLQKNSDEIIKLLSEYNPHWQDAGQSLADSLLNGVNSKKQSIQEAVKEAINLKEIIPIQEKELDRLKKKLEEYEKLKEKANTSSASGGDVDSSAKSSSLDSSSAKLDAGELEEYAGGIDDVKTSVEGLDLVSDELVTGTVPKIEGSAGKLSESIKKGFSGIGGFFGGIEKWLRDTDKNINEWLASAKNSIGDFFSKVKDKFKEGIENIGGFFGGLGNKISEGFAGAGDFFTELGDKAQQGFASIKDKAIENFSGLGEWFKETWSKIGDAIGSGLKSGLDFFTSTVPEWFTDIGDKIKEECGKIGEKISSFFNETMPAIINSIVEWFKQIPYNVGFIIGSIAGFFVDLGANLYAWATETLPEIISSIVEWFASLPEKISEFFSIILQNIQTWGENFKVSVSEFFSTIWENITQFFTELPEKISEWFNAVVETVSGWGENLKQLATDIFNQFVDNVLIPVSELPGKLWEKFTDIINKVNEWGSNLLQKGLDIASKFLENVMKFFSELPGKIKEKLDDIIRKVTEWGTNLINKALEIAKNFFNNIYNTVSQLPGKFREWLDNIISNVISWGTNLVKQAGEAGKNMANAVKDALKDLPSKIMSIGKDVVRGLWEGITGMGGWLKDQVLDFAGNVIDGFRDGFGVHSPSIIMRDLIGRNLVRGVGVGIDVETPGLKEKIEKNISELTGKLKATVNFETSKMQANIVASTDFKAGKETAIMSNNKADEANENQAGIKLNIENFVNNRQQDIENLFDEILFLAKRKGVL